jgi:glucose-1-phosphate thymidylyltransferase
VKARAIIPVAGMGTRLRPHTHTTPKPLLNVAGQPILGHILCDLRAQGVSEVVLVVGHMGEQIRDFVDARFPDLVRHYVDQPERLGLGHAVALARPFVASGPALVYLGDSIFEADLAGLLASTHHCVGVKEVDDPRRFGIVELKDGWVSRLVEKPDRPTSNLAITGLYFFADALPLFDALAELQRRGQRTKGEFQLTDALQILVDRGERLRPFPVTGWYDCGKTETLLETNRVLLARREDHPQIPGSVVVSPVAVHPDATVEGSIVGPYASVAAGAVIRNSVVRDSIVNENAVVEDILLESSVVGDNATVKGGFKRLNVGDSSEVRVT